MKLGRGKRHHLPAVYRNTHLFAEGLEPLSVHVLPDLLHVIPVRDDAVLKRVPDLQQTPELRRRLLPDKDLALERAGQDTQVLGTADERGEVALWQVVAREAGADGAGAIVQDDGRVVQRVRHLARCIRGSKCSLSQILPLLNRSRRSYVSSGRRVSFRFRAPR